MDKYIRSMSARAKYGFYKRVLKQAIPLTKNRVISLYSFYFSKVCLVLLIFFALLTLLLLLAQQIL